FPGGVTLITLGDQIVTAADTVTGVTGGITITVGPSPLRSFAALTTRVRGDSLSCLSTLPLWPDLPKNWPMLVHDRAGLCWPGILLALGLRAAEDVLSFPQTD